jgi:hypothetical protein
MTIQKSHEWLDIMLDKAQSGFIAPEEKDDALHRASLSVFASYLTQYVETGRVHVALNPFREIYEFTAANMAGGGYLALPSDFEHPTGLMLGSGQGVRIIRPDELPFSLKSVVRPVTSTTPVAVFTSKDVATITSKSKLRFYPKVNTYVGELYYLKTPPTPVHNYTMNGRRVVYNPSGSVDLPWSDTTVNAVLMKSLEFLGISLNDQQLAQYAGQKTIGTA